MMASKKALLIALTLTLTSCAGVCKPVKLPLPTPNLLPSIHDAELSCVSDETYSRLVWRDVERDRYCQELEAVIRSTQ